jgi:FAD/FMN-containing dehydrogenase
MWADPAGNERNIAWLRQVQAATRPHATGRAYANFLTESSEDRVRAAYGAGKYARLAEIKGRYDPHNLFRRNHNIRPSKGPETAAGQRNEQTP